MNEHDTDPAAQERDAEGKGLSLRAGGLATSLSLVLLGCIVMYGSLQQGIGWDDAGPMPGYFPFYIGLLLALSSLGTALGTLAKWSKGRGDLTTRPQLRRVLGVFIPICVYAALMRYLGMYVASGLLIAWFMRRMAEQGTAHGWIKTVVISVAVPVACYFIFTRWFQVPLYAGPFPAWFGA
ncbi:tripartite tricarboxylate transporter TctB family protein [Candidimonas humi]|uniref:Tripartite tricarboxylate transporter TctB family protein n=1 Tax=Candidimonas humi TaxID=683355 RepID=A0ABV8P5T9_9BURK|nr:tripartite tricarboxylate transporter TctB family protein [Candidimonas humi]MBV6307161.1 tripartite tricarboxylate transporter TctB family protein [Candidimonas humi]